MKAFPTEALTHAPISALLDLVKDNDLRPDDVEKIQIRSLARAADILADPSKSIRTRKRRRTTHFLTSSQRH
jgi:2-methylcitrate dehydratase